MVEDGDKNDDKGGDWGDKDGSLTKAPTSTWDRKDDDPADDGGGDDDDEPAKSCDVPDGCADSAARRGSDSALTPRSRWALPSFPCEYSSAASRYITSRCDGSFSAFATS